MAKPVEKEWTIMFYFASDDPMAPIIVSQLKAITSAGFHQDVNVLCHFDPHTKGTDTHVFDVNGVSKLIEKKKHPKARYKFWGANDPYIRNLAFDKLWNEGAEFPNGTGIRQSIREVLRSTYGVRGYNPPQPGKMTVDKREHRDDKKALPAQGGTQEPGPRDSLGDFLKFCATSYPARHYMLFMLGHGLVVGNDMFLKDSHGKESSLSLINLGKVLKSFSDLRKGKKLDLIGFHSCSMSGIEVAYELGDTANYMLASQGPAFVGSWPYREILFRIFNDVIKKEDPKQGTPPVGRSIEKIFEYILRYSYDFQLAGYSFDLSLCDLRQIGQVKVPLSDLAKLLKESLNGVPLVKEAILLAHWDAQSFWQESYTDLYDFCFCLKRRCETMSRLSPKAAVYLRRIAAKCKRVLAVLEKDRRNLSASERRKAKRNKLIVRAAFAGPLYQYSHGLSVYFPWSEPTNRFFWEEEYKTRYAFKATAWHEFLQAYFELTQRKPVELENGETSGRKPTLPERILEEITCKLFNVNGPLNTLAGGKGGSGGGLGPGDEDVKGGPGGGLGPGDEDVKGGPGGGLGPGDEDVKGGAGGGLGPGDEDLKGGPGGGLGGDSGSSSIKNYPSFTRARPGGGDDPNRAKSGSSELFRVLAPVKKRP